MRAQGNAEEGFTLLEVLIAIVILMFGLVAVSNLILVAVSSNAVANYGTMATAAASEQMERLMNMTTDGTIAGGGPVLQVGGDIDNDVALFCRDDNMGSRAQTHTRWSVAQVSGSPVTYYIQVSSEGRFPLFAFRTRATLTSYRVQTPQQ